MHPTLPLLQSLEPELRAGESLNATFIHPSMVMVAMPVKAPADPLQSHFGRAYPGAKCSLSIISKPWVNPETNETVHFGVPYGTTPRLLCMYLARRARETNSRFIEIGPLKPFIHALGLTPGRATHIAKMQTLKLSRSEFYVDYLYEKAGRKKTGTKNKPLIEDAIFEPEDFMAFHEKRYGDIKFPDGIVLTKETFDAYTSDDMIAAPMECLIPIAQSCAALDLFGHLVARLPVIPAGTREHLSFRDMSGMFGEKHYARNASRYRYNIASALESALAQLPNAHEVVEEGVDEKGHLGLWLSHSDPSRFGKLFVTNAAARQATSKRPIREDRRRMIDRQEVLMD